LATGHRDSEGETDGNPNTIRDPSWTPLRPTPPDQDYASGHSMWWLVMAPAPHLHTFIETVSV